MQVVLVSVITLLCWFTFGRKKQSFLKWMGLKIPKIHNRIRFFTFLILGFSLFSLIGVVILLFFTNKSAIAASQFYGVGISGIIAALLYAFVQTGLSEEMLFRGFIGKRAISAFGFVVGNTMQALLFGCLHGIMFYFNTGILNAAIISTFTAVIGWVMGYINEKLSDGSIIPSWILHGCANLFSAFMMMFKIL
ncbi:CPBP family intramembrane metalloprotease [Paenibacillus sp. ACRRX]|nr:CPBP family intramembrane metalloprotease [Paenibacillus sp. ACRRX]